MELEASWKGILQEELEKPYYAALLRFIAEERKRGAVYPPKELVFSAFAACRFDQVKVVIVGQDPYHGPGQAHGLCFSVQKGVPLPPSLKNIYKELETDLGLPSAPHGCLSAWARQGVLLLNTTLTVRGGEPLSHAGQGWETFTNAVLRKLGEGNRPLVFILWGRHAKDKYLQAVPQPPKSQHLILTAAHPSPFSVAHFYGCRHFSKTNEFLRKHELSPIDFRISS